MSEKKQGGAWAVIGIIRKGNQEIKRVRKSVLAGSEADLERAEKALKRKLADEALKDYGIQDLKSVRIEVELEIEG